MGEEAVSGKRIGFVGTFEVANYGDCLFPVVYEKLLAERLDACEFAYYSPRPAAASPLGGYGPVTALPETTGTALFDCDVLIQCGGETLSLGHSAGTYNFPASGLSAFARMWLGPTIAASRGECAFLVHSVGMPTTNLDDHPTIAQALQYADRVSLRDKVSARRLGDTFPVEVDPMFAMSTILAKHEWRALATAALPPDFVMGSYLCAHISAPYLTNDLDTWCEQIAIVARDTDLPLLLIPICHFLWDKETLEAAREKFLEKGLSPDRIALPLPDSEQVLTTAALLGNSAGVITSSLHALVTAISFGVPFAGFGGEGKLDGKHNQTLAAAGVDFGVSPHIATLAETFAHSQSQDISTRQTEAIARALRDFDRLVDAIRCADPVAKPMPQELIDELVSIDLRPTRDAKFEMKRTLLRLLNESGTARSALRARRRARMLKGVAN